MSQRVTQDNSHLYVGREVVFKTRGLNIIRTITRVSNSGKTIHINQPDLNNQLQVVSRKVCLYN